MAQRDLSSFLPNLIGPLEVRVNGTEVDPRRGIWDFTGSVSIVDVPNESDPTESYTRWTIGGASETGVTLSNASSGTLDDVVTVFNSKPAAMVRFTAGSAVTLRGLAGGSLSRILIVLAAGAGNVTIANEATGSSAENRIVTGTGASVTVPAGAGAVLAYDSTSTRWRVAGLIGDGGESNTSSNVGGGVELAKAKAGFDLPFRTLVAGSNVTLTQNADTVTIAASGGTSFTAGGDLSGTASSQTVEKVKGTTITTAGGSLPVGAVLRTTGASTATWGAVDLADADAVTGVLPVANGGIGSALVLGSAFQPMVVNSGATGYEAATNWTLSTGLTGGASSFVALGTTPSLTGEIRLPASSSIRARRTSNDMDQIGVTFTNNNIEIGAPVASTGIGTTGTVTIGCSTGMTFRAASFTFNSPGNNQLRAFIDANESQFYFPLRISMDSGQYIAIGSNSGATPASVGDLRLKAAATIYSRGPGNENARLVAFNLASDYHLTLGESTNVGRVILQSSTEHIMRIGASSDVLTIAASAIKCGQPVQGNSSPLRFSVANITATAGVSSNTTATAAQFECPIIVFTTNADGQSLILPNQNGAVYIIQVTGSGVSATVKVSGQTGVTISGGATAIVRCNGTDYVRVTANA